MDFTYEQRKRNSYKALPDGKTADGKYINNIQKMRSDSLKGVREGNVYIHYSSDKPEQTGRAVQVYTRPAFFGVSQGRKAVVQMYTLHNEQCVNLGLDTDSHVMDEDEYREWEQQISQGVALAKEKLTLVRDNERNPDIRRYVISMLAALNQSLDIYPLFGGGNDGLSVPGRPAMSILCGMDEERTVKTIIHEAFHISGGCCVKDSRTGRLKPRPDEINCDDTDLDDLKTKITTTERGGKRNIRTVNADTIAQYVMVYAGALS